MARMPPVTVRRGWAAVTVGPAGEASVVVVVMGGLLWGRSMMGTSGGGGRLDSSRARRAATNSARGSTAATGWRSTVSGSAGMVTPVAGFVVGAAEGDTCAHQQRFGGVQRAAELVGHLGYRQVVDVPQGQGHPVVRRHVSQDSDGEARFELVGP